MHHHVGAVVDGAQEAWRGHGIVHHQRHPGGMGDLGQGLDVGDVAGGVADALAEDCARLRADQARDVVHAVARRIARRDPLARQHV